MRMKWTHLTWNKASWPDKTYRARSGGRSFTIDPGGDAWRLRGWVDGAFAVFEEGETVAALQERADEIMAAA